MGAYQGEHTSSNLNLAVGRNMDLPGVSTLYKLQIASVQSVNEMIKHNC